MKRILTSVLLALIAASAPIAATAAPKSCPPGLAKKGPACLTPEQAKKIQPGPDKAKVRHHQIGERITGDFILIRDPAAYGLNPGLTYYRTGDTVYQVNPDTAAVMKLIGALSALNN